jgi:hypothetical protein
VDVTSVQSVASSGVTVASVYTPSTYSHVAVAPVGAHEPVLSKLESEEVSVQSVVSSVVIVTKSASLKHRTSELPASALPSYVMVRVEPVTDACKVG